MKFELHAAEIVKDEIKKGRKVLLLHKRRSHALKQYISERETEVLKKKLH